MRMPKIRGRRFARVTATAVSVTALVTVSAVTAFADTRELKWTVTEPPALDNGYALRGMEALAADDVWAVGGGANGRGSPVALHWDGASWESTPAPSGTSLVEVASVDGVLWAVGYDQAGDKGQLLTARWSGGEWSRIPSPAPEVPEDQTPFLLDVDGASADDVWAVGATGDSIEDPAAILNHWDGKKWSPVDVPVPDGTVNSGLTAVEAVAPDDVWAAGYTIGSDNAYHPFVLHWDGENWTARDVPGDTAELTDVTVAGDGRVWVSGTVDRWSSTPKPVLLRYDGEDWTPLDVPVEAGELRTVAPDGKGGVLAAGTGTGEDPGLVLSCDGDKVTEQNPPPSDASAVVLTDLTLVPDSSTVWVTGFTGKFTGAVAAYTT